MEMNLAAEIEEYRNEEEVNQENQTNANETQDVQEINLDNSGENLNTSSNNFIVPLIDLFTWADTKLPAITTHAKIRLQVAGVDEDTIIIKGPKLGSSDEDAKELHLLKNTKSITVPDVIPTDLLFFKNGTIRFISALESGNDQPVTIFMKSYILTTTIVNVLCLSLNDVLIPFKPFASKKPTNNLEIERIENIANRVIEKLEEDPDVEAIEILYKQFGKVKGDMHTKEDIIKWLVKRQNESIDVNHHLLIDRVLLTISGI